MLRIRTLTSLAGLLKLGVRIAVQANKAGKGAFVGLVASWWCSFESIAEAGSSRNCRY